MPEWRRNDEGRAGKARELAAQGSSASRRRTQGRGADVPACRHFAQDVLQVEAADGAHGAAGVADRSHRPHQSPRATSPDVVRKLLYLRQTYHFGPGRIAAYLQRFHRLVIAASSVHRILARHGLNRLPANQRYRPHGKRWQRYEKPQPGHRLQLDVKFSSGFPRPRHSSTRSPRSTTAGASGCSRSSPRATSEPPFSSWTTSFAVCPSGSSSCRPTTAPSSSHATGTSRAWNRHVYIRARTPHLNGKVERSHRVDDEEFYQLLDANGISGDIHLFNAKLREWGGLLQLPSASWRSGRPDALRATHRPNET